MMGIIIWLIVGGVIGWLASMIMKTDGQQGIFLNIIVGIIGAFLGGWLFNLLGLTAGGLIGALVTAVVGACALLWLISLIKKKGG